MTDTTPNPDVRRTVLCAVADDDHLQDVVAAGRALAQGAGLRVLFVHVAAPAIRLRSSLSFGAGAGAALRDVPIPGGTIDDLKDEAHRVGLELVTRAGIGEDEAIVTDGDPGIEINRLAAEHDAALVVVGSHGRGAIAGALVGSVSRKLALEGHCPVLVARSTAVPCVGGPVICGIDLSDDDDQVLRPAIHAAQLARLMDRRLVLVYVLTADHRLPASAGALLAAPQILRPTQHQRQRIGRLLEAVRLPGQRVESCVVQGNSVGAELDRFAGGRGADLLVVGARRRGIVQRTLEGGVLRELLRSGRQPLVIVPPG